MPLPSQREHRSDNRGYRPGYRPHPGGFPRPSDSYWAGCYYWNGSYYYWGGAYYSPDRDRFGRYRSLHPADFEESMAPSSRAVFFFPPIPPPLGVLPPPKSPEIGRIEAPTELALSVNEPFYAPLGTRLQARDLSKKLLQRLKLFSQKKEALRDELLSEIERWKDASLAVRLIELEKISRKQAAGIRALETEAELLRTDLLYRGLVGAFWGSGGWNEGRPWRLDVGALSQPRDETLAYEFKVMRAAVYYQDGLSPAQRRLLREVAMELQIEAFHPYSRTTTPEDSPLFFQPETARLRLSANLPPELASKLAVFKKEKTVLKTELRDALYHLDAVTASERLLALRQLADRQAVRLDNLDVLAEGIRKLLTPDELLKEQDRSHLPEQIRREDKIYRHAVLLPGLSPEQRRLLFDGALEKLALPLPPGENVPW